MIFVKQIDSLSLTNFIEASISGASFSGILVAYVGASGWLGNHVVYSSGGAQTLLGTYTFTNSITLPYTGTSGQSISKKYVDDVFASVNSNLSGWATGYFVNLSTDQLISGKKSFTGALGIGFALASGDAVQLYQFTGASGALQTAINGITIANTVFTTGDQTIQGFKIFTGSPWVADPTQPSGAVNLETLTGTSGVLRAYVNSVTGGISGTVGPSGASGASIVGPSGATGPAGSGIYFVNSGTITGNFVNLSFFLDPVGTGINLFESFVANTFYFTGAAFACRTSGYGPTNGGILSGTIYQVNQLNVETSLYAFTFTSGIIYSGSPLFASLVTGNNRIGLSITNSLSGIQKFCVGIYGGNYV